MLLAGAGSHAARGQPGIPAAAGGPPAAGAAGAPTGAGPRLALLIGNAAYRRAPLQNPVNDARLLASALRPLGFDTEVHENLVLHDLIETLREFSLRSRAAEVRLLFYAGHGLQVRGRNYLVPVDSDIATEEEIPAATADANEFVDRLGQLGGLSIVILDACRNNPYSGAEVLGPDGRRYRFRGTTRDGLAALPAPAGTIVAFSTSPGGVALDHPGAAHGLYARHLAGNLAVPGLTIEGLFKRVRAAVSRDSRKMQVPWESSSLTGDFCFRPGPRGGCGTESGELDQPNGRTPISAPWSQNAKAAQAMSPATIATAVPATVPAG